MPRSPYGSGGSRSWPAMRPSKSDSLDIGRSMQYPSAAVPRLVVAGLSGDSGKTVISLGLLLLARQSGIPAKAFKKGPDYIDAAWLSWASGGPARNLDTFLMGRQKSAQLFRAHALPRRTEPGRGQSRSF